MSKNIFEKIMAREIPAEIVFEDESVLAFRDINPKAPAHVLIIPKKRIERLAEAAPEDEALLGHLLLKAAQVAGQLGLNQSGYRLVINNGKDGGETVPHLHCHILGGRGLAWPPGMITFLQGKLVESLPTQVTVEVNGVGYEALIPLSSFDKLPGPGQPIKLLTHLVVREDAHVLYGFMTAAERAMFRLLIHTVSGIGPKIALNILSGINVTAFRGAVAGGDVKMLSQISGVGKKTAERIVVELKDKVGAGGALEAESALRALSADEQKTNDATLALMALGFKQVEAHEAIRGAAAVLGPSAGVEELVRAALKKGG